MSDKERYDIRLLIRLFVIGKLEHFVLGHVRFHYHIIRVFPLHNLGSNVFGRTFAQIVYIGFECQSHNGHTCLAVVFELEILYGPLRFFRTPESLVIVYLTRFGYKLRLDRKIGRNEVRVHRNAMPAHSAAGPQYVYTRMFVGQRDEFPHVYSRFFTYQGQFVCKSYLHVTRRIFRQLAHLGRLGVGGMQFTLYKLRIKFDGFFR